MNRIVLLIVLVLAAVFDARESRIPNRLCLTALAAGIILIIYNQGIGALLVSFILALLLFVIMFPFWSFRVIGAGDVKLIMVSGVLLGKEVWSFLACAGGCTAVLSLLIMMSRKNFLRRMEVFFYYLRSCFMEKRMLLYPFDRSKDSDDGGIRVAYGLLAGHILAMAAGMYGGI